MIARTVCVLGATGFVGHHLVPELARHGYQVRVVTRRYERARGLLTVPGIEVIEGDINDEARLRECFAGCYAVINLVAVLHERRMGDFQRLHVDLPARIARICEQQQVSRLLHISALHAGRTASHYLDSKGRGEVQLRQGVQHTRLTIFRPSVIFGPGDHFFTRFATLLRLAPGIFPVVCAQARLAPVYVGDITTAMIAVLDQPTAPGGTYELCGPRSYTLQELVALTARTTGVRRYLPGLGMGSSRLVAAILGHLPGRLFTYDNYRSLQIDNVCSRHIGELFQISPHSVEGVIAGYLD
ncbi:MAG: complex I NDUFA9 subunit family protein [Gammaproteobacteria bacterium]|nr:complex I NDUFA9 subunit family protein [Gammaproteobacteria bacterium]